VFNTIRRITASCPLDDSSATVQTYAVWEQVYAEVRLNEFILRVTKSNFELLVLLRTGSYIDTLQSCHLDMRKIQRARCEQLVYNSTNVFQLAIGHRAEKPVKNYVHKLRYSLTTVLSYRLS
jgi:hypothetical protein